MSAIVTVGRGQQADVQLTEEHVSRKHFQLTLTEDGWVFENISTLRSRVNGKKYKSGKKIILDTGDVIAVGSATELLFVATGDDTEAALIAYRQSGARKGKPRSAAAPAPAAVADQQMEPSGTPQPDGAEVLEEIKPAAAVEEEEEAELDSEELAALEQKAKYKKYGTVFGVYIALLVVFVVVLVTLVPRRGPRREDGKPDLMNRDQIENAITVKLRKDRNPVEAGNALDKALLALEDTHEIDYLYRSLYWFKLSRAYGAVLSTEDDKHFNSVKKLLTTQVQERYFNACAQEGDHKYVIAFNLFQRLLKMLPLIDRQDEKNEFRKNIRAHMAYINRKQQSANRRR
jgi:hypothetical protein